MRYMHTYCKQRVSINIELLVKRLNVVLHSLDQLSLVFHDGTSNVGAHKQSIEAGEDAEHFIGISCSSKLVS